MKPLRWLGSALLITCLSTTAAFAEDITLTVHHFLSPKSNAHTKMIQAWTDKVSKESNGKIKFELFPAMAMGGKPSELYGQVRDGTADIVWTLLGYTPGVFPRSEVYELPLVHKGSAAATTVALNATMDMLADDFKDVKVLFLHANDGNVIHSATKPVRTFEDAKGMKLRTPSRTGSWVIEGMGAEAVGLPVPELPEAMSKGAIDGALTTLEIVPALKLQELDKYVTELPDGDRFGTAIFMFTMNKDSYNNLPDDLKKVIDDNSGMKVAADIGKMWEEFEKTGDEALASAKVERIVLSADEAAKFKASNEKVVARWIEESKTKGFDGAVLVEKARAAIAEASK